MNCKNCGKRLSEKALYCDRCGTPVKATRTSRSTTTAKKNSSGRTSTAVATKKPQTDNRDSYDRYRKKKMQRDLELKRRRRRARIAIVWAIFLALAGAIGGGIYAYTYMMRGVNPQPTPEPTEEVQVEETELPEATIEPESTEKAKSTEKAEDDAASNGCETYIDRAYGFKCAYPADFVTGSLANKNTRLSLKDPDGDGEMLISYEKISKSETATNLMRDYVGGLGVDPDFNRAGEKWYSVTFTRNGRVNHRKATILDSTQLVYYDFVYDQGSDNRNKYEDYIDYMDDYIEKQALKSNKN